MEIQFCRTGERRYAITIRRKNSPAIEMNPAPGYDALMPHDLLHFVVESELRLRHGIFGQIAEGGNAGTFHQVSTAGEDPREAARLRRRASKRGDKLRREGRQESALSEHATYVCLYQWLSRSADAERRKLARQMAPLIKPGHIPSPAEGLALSEARLAQICRRLDDLSARWASLGIGQSFSVEWPERN